MTCLNCVQICGQAVQAETSESTAHPAQCRSWLQVAYARVQTSRLSTYAQAAVSWGRRRNPIRELNLLPLPGRLIPALSPSSYLMRAVHVALLGVIA